MSRVIADGLSKKVLAKGLTFTGGLAAPKITASTGILFGTDTAAANTLDDYEEGTFTPTINGTGVSANLNGSYTKVGRLVNFRLLINLSSKGTSSGNVSLNGIPFNAANITSNNHSLSIYKDRAVTIQALILEGTDQINLYRLIDSNASNSRITWADLDDNAFI